MGSRGFLVLAEIKICGVNATDFAVEAERLGADYLGFIFAAESPRRVTAEDFIRRTDGGRRTPVYREFLADRETPVAVLSRVVDDENVFLLESVSGGENPGRYSYLGIDPTDVVVAESGEAPQSTSRTGGSKCQFSGLTNTQLMW